MSKTLKILLVIGILMYTFSPMDLIPGPIDDAIVIALGIAANRAALSGKA